MNDKPADELGNPAPPAPTEAPATAPPPAPASAAAPPAVETKSPGLAGLLSIFPGLGHLYLGLYPRAFAIAAAFVLSIAMAHNAGRFFGPVIAFVWFFGIIDAVRQAKAINRGFVAESGFAPREALRRASAGTGALTWGVILVGLGSLALIDRYVEVDWSFMADWGWPTALILLGVVLIATHVVRKRRKNESEVWPPRENV